MKTPVYSKIKAVAVSGATVASALAILSVFGVTVPVDPQTIADNINAAIAAIVLLVTLINAIIGWAKPERVGGVPTVHVGEPSDAALAQSTIEELSRVDVDGD